jgi:hypothetical protein
VCILYTHLGKVTDPEDPFDRRTRAALNLVAQHYREGRLLVTTTSRALAYCRALREVTTEASAQGDILTVRISRSVKDPGTDLAEELRGLSLYVRDPAKTRVMLNGHEVLGLEPNDPDHTGRPSLSFPWPPLRFPGL